MDVQLVEQIAAAVVARLEALPARPVQEWYSIKQAGVVAGMCEDYVRRAVLAGQLTCVNMGTKAKPLYRINHEDLTAWMRAREACACPPPRKGSSRPVTTFYE